MMTRSVAHADAEMGDMLSISWLASRRNLGLRVVHDSGRSFGMVHPCELENPEKYVGEGTLVLLTGIAFRDHPEAFSDYVARLSAAGAAGIGFGVGVVFPEVPHELADAALAHDVSLLTIPLDVPFISVSTAVHRELAQRRERRLEVLLELQGCLNLAAGQGLNGLVTRTAQALDASVCLVDLDGRVSAAAVLPGFENVELTHVIDDARHRGFGIAGKVGEINVLAHRLSPSGNDTHGLVAIADHYFDANQRALLKHAAGLAELIIRRPQELRRAQRELTTLAVSMQLGLTGRDESMQRIFRQASDTEGKVRPVLVKSESARAHARFIEALDRNLAEQGRLLFAVEVDDLTWLFLLRGNRSMRNIQELLLDIRGGKRIVVGSPLEWSRLRESTVRDLEKVAFGLQPGALVGPESRTLNWLGDEAVGAAVAHRFAETWGKLREYDAAHGSEYEQTLQAYLRNGGHYVRTADALNTHRHTVRKRIADAAEILEIDLDDPIAVAELVVLGVAGAGASSF
ncbi:TPA: PucR family transcriptional regulator ligand-binding domain-containing protein [Corynebacterium striatum]|nr:PucR family transcriptional regulator ligand-binding domain-containing protein [Corynebacterium striatum]